VAWLQEFLRTIFGSYIPKAHLRGLWEVPVGCPYYKGENPYACIFISTNVEEALDFLRYLAQDGKTVEIIIGVRNIDKLN
jgi:hypothetical protein